MLRSAFALFVIACSMAQCSTRAAWAQGRVDRSSEATSAREMPVTPEMWFYQQARRDYDDPRIAVRRKAEFRAAQRRMRLAAKRWRAMTGNGQLISWGRHLDAYSTSWSSTYPDPLTPGRSATVYQTLP